MPLFTAMPLAGTSATTTYNPARLEDGYLAEFTTAGSLAERGRLNINVRPDAPNATVRKVGVVIDQPVPADATHPLARFRKIGLSLSIDRTCEPGDAEEVVDQMISAMGNSGIRQALIDHLTFHS